MSEENKKLPGSLEEWLKHPDEEGVNQRDLELFTAGLVLSALAVQAAVIPELAAASKEVAINLVLKKEGGSYEETLARFESTAEGARKRYQQVVWSAAEELLQKTIEKGAQG